MTKKKKVVFELVHINTTGALIMFTKKCEKENHTQQAAFSTYFSGLTQVCFDCKAVRTTI